MADDPDMILRTVPALLLVANEAGSVLWANAEAEHLFGYAENSLQGAPLATLLPVSDLGAIIRESVSEFPHRASTILEAPSNAAGPHYVDIRATRWKTAGGETRYTLALTDVTERVLSEQKQRTTMRRWEHALVGAKIGVFEVDLLTGKSIVSATWKTLMGIAEEEEVDSQAEWLSRIHPDDLPMVQAADRDCVEGRVQRSITEYRLRTRDGREWRWMRSDAVAASRDGSGRALCLIGAQTDITEGKEVDNLLRMQNGKRCSGPTFPLNL